jgi:hypothetical protein
MNTTIDLRKTAAGAIYNMLRETLSTNPQYLGACTVMDDCPIDETTISVYIEIDFDKANDESVAEFRMVPVSLGQRLFALASHVAQVHGAKFVLFKEAGGDERSTYYEFCFTYQE